MINGDFRTTRHIFCNSLWKHVLEFRLFFLIYGNAVWCEGGIKYGNITVKRGQLLRSYRNLQNDLEYIENNTIKKPSLSQIKRAADNLVEQNRLTVEQTELGTLFEVVNYDKYQPLRTEMEHPKQPDTKGTKEPPTPTDGTRLERQRNNNKKDNKDKNNNLNTNASDNGFEKFWSAYPKKRSKGQAEKVWKKIKPNEQLLTVMLAKLERAKTSVDWLKESGKYIPYPATWLNVKGWEDEYSEGGQPREPDPEDKRKRELIKKLY